MRKVKLYGRIFLEMDIRAVTGLRIGGSPAGLGIGDLDNPVIRDPLTQQPYIPGSSMRGKMRSLWEKATGADQNFPIRRNPPEVYIHMLKGGKPKDYENDAVCRIFGVTGENDVPTPTRLIVHDAFLSRDSVVALEKAARTDQPYTETKWEAVIDRVTSAAVPRQMERVPAGVVFSDFRLVYSVFGTLDGKLGDIDWFPDILTMLQLVEDDYLGSSGSRGSGRIKFENVRLMVRNTKNNGKDYGAIALQAPAAEGETMTLQGFLDGRKQLLKDLHKALAQ